MKFNRHPKESVKDIPSIFYAFLSFINVGFVSVLFYASYKDALLFWGNPSLIRFFH